MIYHGFVFRITELKEMIIEYPMGDDPALWDEFQSTFFAIMHSMSLT